MAATMLLRNMPEPLNSQARRIRDEVQTLFQVAAVQQAESSASRQGAATKKRDEPAQNEKEVSVHQQPPPSREEDSTRPQPPRRQSATTRRATRHQRELSPSMWGHRRARLQRPPRRAIRQRRGPDGPGTAGPLGVQQSNSQHTAAQPVPTMVGRAHE